MYQFITGITFEIVLIIIFGVGYFVMRGAITIGEPTPDFISWRQRNGRIVRMVCIMTIVVLLASIISKYTQYNYEPAPTLQR